MILPMFAIGRNRSCSRKLEGGLCSPLSWLPPPPPTGLAGASDMVAGTLIGAANRRTRKSSSNLGTEKRNPRERREKRYGGKLRKKK